MNNNINNININDDINGNRNDDFNDDICDDDLLKVENENNTNIHDADLYITLDDIKNTATENKEQQSETESVTDSLIDRLWQDLELQNRKSVRSEYETATISRVSAAEYVPPRLPRLPLGTLNYKFPFIDQHWKFIDNKIIRSPRSSAKVAEAIAKIESKTIDEHIIDHYETEIQKILNKEKEKDIKITDNIDDLDDDNNEKKAKVEDSGDESITNGLSYYDAQEVAISLASIRMFYKQRDFGYMFKPSVNLSQLQESPRLNLSPEKTNEKPIENKKKSKNNKNSQAPSEPLQSKSSKKTSPRKMNIQDDKLNQKLNQTNSLLRTSEISKYFKQFTEEKGLRTPVCLEE